MSKYRFKTKKEFIRDGLWDDKYNCPEEWNLEGQMNKYLGTNVPEEFNTDCDKNTGFEYNDWVFSEDDYVLKEQQEYFDDLSQHIGRYIRALVDNPHLGSEVKKGDIGKIISYGKADFPNRKSYSCTLALSENYLGTKYELLPEDYSPEQEIKESGVEFIPGKWYNFTTMKGKYNLYVKVASVTDRNLFFMNRESISNGYLGEADCIDIKLIENPRLVEDLSEIQPYLPNEHPDKITSNKFKKGEYIVLIDKGQSTGSATLSEDFKFFIKNHCYKVRENNVFLRPELDSNGSTTNGWECIPYNPNQFHKTRNWRYATQEEIDEYERKGKPYDVAELQKKELSMKEIQEECKRRFPIGCTFIDTDGDKQVLKEDSVTYQIKLNMIYAHDCAGYLYKNGKWAELVSSPKQNDLKEEVIKYSEETNATILLASNIKSKELHSTYGNTSLSVKLLSNKTTPIINNVRVISSVNLKIK